MQQRVPWIRLLVGDKLDHTNYVDAIPKQVLDTVSLQHVTRLRFPEPMEQLYLEFDDAFGRQWIASVIVLVLSAFLAWLVVSVINPQLGLVTGDSTRSAAVIGAVLILAAVLRGMMARQWRLYWIQRIISMVFVLITMLIGFLRIPAVEPDLSSALLPLFVARMLLPLMLRLRFGESLLPIAMLTAATLTMLWMHYRDINRLMISDSLLMSAIALVIMYLQERESRRNFFQQATIHHLAMRDSLTGLRNRRRFWLQLEESYQAACRSGSALSLIVLDLDHFKRVNDTHGHDVGDQALILASQICQASVPNQDSIGRLGGEEFGVILPNTNSTQAYAIAQQLRRQLAQTPILIGDKRITCTMSIGVVTLSDQQTSPDELMQAADRALYRAKSNGRNCVEVG